MSNDFHVDINTELCNELRNIDVHLPLAVISPNSQGVLDDQFRNIYKMTMAQCNFLNYFSNVKGSVWHKFFKRKTTEI